MHSVVIVDDHPVIRRVLRYGFEAAGEFNVVGEAEDGPIALSVVRDQQPDFVVIDLELPRLSGLELIERLRKLQPSVKLLVFSAKPQSIYASRSALAGANGFVSKAEDIQAVIRVAQTILAGYDPFPHGVASLKSMAPASDSPFLLVENLSDHELDILKFLALGMSNIEIGDRMLVSNKTVSTHKARIFRKLGITTLTELLELTRAHSLLD